MRSGPRGPVCVWCHHVLPLCRTGVPSVLPCFEHFSIFVTTFLEESSPGVPYSRSRVRRTSFKIKVSEALQGRHDGLRAVFVAACACTPRSSRGTRLSDQRQVQSAAASSARRRSFRWSLTINRAGTPAAPWSQIVERHRARRAFWHDGEHFSRSDPASAEKRALRPMASKWRGMMT